MASVREILSRVAAAPGVRAVVLAGREGLSIETAGRGDTRLFDALAALGTSALATAESLGQEMGPGPGAPIGALLEYDRAMVSVDPLGAYAAIVTLAESAASLGRVRQTLAASRDELLRTLDLR